jgi:hypothetical protein
MQLPLAVITPWTFFAWALVALVLFVLFAFVGIVFVRVRKDDTKLATQAIEVEKQSRNDPTNSKLAWELARVTLEKYFNRNLQQVNAIFYVAVIVMIVGFALVIYGAFLGLEHPETKFPAELSAIAGIITEFISVTFMVIYKSTLQQASGYMTILEKINTVGMAVQIVDTIPPGDALYTSTRSTMAKQLLEQFKAGATHFDKPTSKTS